MPHSNRLPARLKKVPAGRIFMIHKRGWGNLPGFGRKHPHQQSDLKSEHPGLVVKDSQYGQMVVEVVPGTSRKHLPSSYVFQPKDEFIPPSDKKGCFLLQYWRTVRKKPNTLRAYFADLTESDCIQMQIAMDRVHGERWLEKLPSHGTRN